MEYKQRYGKIPVLHPVFLFCGLIAISIILATFYFSELYILLLEIVPAFFIHKNISAFSEKFVIEDKIIKSKIGKKQQDDIRIPDDVIFIISYASTEEGLLLKDRFILNIVKGDSVQVLERLHKNNFYSLKLGNFYNAKSPVYDNEIIRHVFKENFVFSFAFEQETIIEFLNFFKRPLIIPETLINKINIESDSFEIIIDDFNVENFFHNYKK